MNLGGVFAIAVLTLPSVSPAQLKPQTGSEAHGKVPSGEMSAETVFRRYAGAVLTLTCETSLGESKLGSGVLITPDGYLATNAHVIADCTQIEAAQIVRGYRHSFVPVLRFFDDTSDVAVMKIESKQNPFIRIADREPRIGENVYAIGNPRGFEQSITEGIVSGNREFDDSTWVQHTAPISPGSSGGALISADGKLVGINCMLLKDSENLNFAVPSSVLESALRRARLVEKSIRAPQAGETEFNIGMLYVRGQGVRQDDDEAEKWIRKAAEKGHPEAQATLGGMYLLGKGVPKDIQQGVLWLQKASEQGFAIAAHVLGVMYSEGTEVPRDDKKAAAYFRAAAEQGVVFGQVSLAVALMNGDGVKQDYKEAYFWLEVVALELADGFKPEGKDAGSLRADAIDSLLQQISEHLSLADLKETIVKSRGWATKHPPQ